MSALIVKVDNHNVRSAGRSEAPRQSPPNPARRPRDDDHPPFYVHQRTLGRRRWRRAGPQARNDDGDHAGHDHREPGNGREQSNLAGKRSAAEQGAGRRSAEDDKPAARQA